MDRAGGPELSGGVAEEESCRLPGSRPSDIEPSAAECVRGDWSWPSSKSTAWRSSTGGIYSVAGVSSSEVAKWDPIPVTSFAEEMIH